MNNIILFGFKGAGKTYLGKLLSEAIKRSFIDTDDRIIHHYAKEKHLIREIHRSLGEVCFRGLEKMVIHQLDKTCNAVISLGGGVILDSDNVAHLQTIGKLVYLKASFESLQERILSQGIPSFLDVKDPIGSLKQTYDARLPIYESIPALTIDVDRLSTAECINAMSQYGL